MGKENMLIGILIEDSYTISFKEVCAQYHIPEELLVELIEQGLFDNQSTEPKKLQLDQKAIHKIESAFRLHKDLGINIPGVTLAIELLEEIEKMHQELAILRRHF